MAKFATTVLCVAAPLLSGAQGLINNGASITITNGSVLTIAGGLVNAAGSTINNNGALRVSGNIANNATLAYNSGTLSLDGNAAQTLGGSADYNAKNVIVNNAAGITLAAKLNVDGTMTFTNGMLNAPNAAYPVVFTTNASVSAPSDASHVNGYVQRLGVGAFTYPVGDAVKYQPIAANLSANSAGMTARYYPSDPGAAPFGNGGSSSTPLLYVNRAEYWDLIPSGTASGDVTLFYDSYKTSGISSASDLRVAHKTGGQWQNEGGTASGTTSAGSITSNTLSTFSPFSLGSISASSPLPLQLMDFTATVLESANRLDWQVAKEDPGTTFGVERATDGAEFKQIGTVGGRGGERRYTFMDNTPPGGGSQYRLRIVASDGSAAYSAIVRVFRNDRQAGMLNILPVPATSELAIINGIGAMNGTTAVILNMHGQLVTQLTLREGRQTLGIGHWPGGVYWLRLADGSSWKIVKQ